MLLKQLPAPAPTTSVATASCHQVAGSPATCTTRIRPAVPAAVSTSPATTNRRPTNRGSAIPTAEAAMMPTVTGSSPSEVRVGRVVQAQLEEQ
jgi:hypothetical protein